MSYLRPAVKKIVNQREGHNMLRIKVRDFVMKSRTQRIIEFKRQFEELDGLVNGETWNHYWIRMSTDKEWVDSWFVQAVAWYLQVNIWIVATSSTNDSPYIQISGNMIDGDMPCDGPILILGTKSNVHFQSLLPIEMVHFDFNRSEANPDVQVTESRKIFIEIKDTNNKTKTKTTQVLSNPKNSDDYTRQTSLIEKEIQEKEIDPTSEIRDNTSRENVSEESDDISFLYESAGYILAFLKMSDDYIMKCPLCQVKTKYIVRHIVHCTDKVDQAEFKIQFRNYKEKKIKEDQVNRKRKSRAKQRAEDVEKVKKDQVISKNKSMAKQRVEDEKKVKKDQINRK